MIEILEKEEEELHRELRGPQRATERRISFFSLCTLRPLRALCNSSFDSNSTENLEEAELLC
jgi:hypothetical protein